MTYTPPSEARFPIFVLQFAREASKYKTPCIRTRGASEAANQQRGEPDWIDSVATIMLWRALVLAGFPVTYELTANGGDETDLRVKVKTSPDFIDINVKGTKTWVPKKSTAAAYGNLPVKCEELGLQLVKSPNGKYKPHPEPVRIEHRDGRPWAISDKAERLADIYIKIYVHTNELFSEHQCSHQDHVHFTNWLPVSGDDFAGQIQHLNERIAAGDPPMIPGIFHAGLWIPSNFCRPYEDLFIYLEEWLQSHGAPDFLLRWKRIDKACIQYKMKSELSIDIMPNWLEFDLDKSLVTCEIPLSKSNSFNACAKIQKKVIEILCEGFDHRCVEVSCGEMEFKNSETPEQGFV